MNPVAYTYDWGVVTDLARRNQARMCGKLGIEHIIVSADIHKKRKNIRKNLQAWLKKPDLGMIPLLMAGDKQMIHFGRKVMHQLKVKLLIHSIGNGLENGYFKIGFSGVRMESQVGQGQIPLYDKLKHAAYYANRYLVNPSYINISLLDTLYAYFCNFMLSDKSQHLFRFIKWDEEEIVSTLINEYDWEISPDTKVTWRIGDGTAAFYNYVYMTVAGFTENDTFRSNQIREGIITRQKGLELIREENKVRYDSIEWYAQQIGFNCNRATRIINSIPKLYKTPSA